MQSIRIAFFSTTKTDKRVFQAHLHDLPIELTFFDEHLSERTVPLAQGFDGVCVFVNDLLSGGVLEQLAEYGVRLVALRCAGFNNVDMQMAQHLKMTVLRVPAYSPMAVAEHAVALMLTLNRKTHKAYNRVRDGNFTLEGLLGFDMCHKTAGIVGTGRIGRQLVPILKGFGMHILAYDPYPSNLLEQSGVQYVELEELYAKADIISLHVPLTPSSKHMIGMDALDKMKEGVMLINTSRGGLLDTEAVIAALKSRKLGYLGIDVYEQEDNLFFEDHSEEIIEDDIFERLVTFPNVLVTAHQAFFTQEALNNIAEITLANIMDFVEDNIKTCNQVVCE